MEAKEKKQIIWMIVATIIIAFIMIWVNTYVRQRREFLKGEDYYNKKDYPKAITAYESALHMYTPWSNMVKKSAEKLWEIGQMYEEKKDIDMALIAYRSLRSSFYAVRSFYTPYPEWIAKTEKKIEELVKIQEEQERIAREEAERKAKEAKEEARKALEESEEQPAGNK